MNLATAELVVLRNDLRGHDVINRAMDKFGIPENMFGAIDDDFAGALGRVAMVGALVESKIDMLLASLDQQIQSEHAGDALSKQITRIENLVASSPPARPTLDDMTRADIHSVVTFVRAVMFKRNDVLHSVWPQPRLSAGLAWRHLPARQRTNEVEWTKSFASTSALFSTLLAELVEIVHSIENVTQRVENVPRVTAS